MVGAATIPAFTSHEIQHSFENSRAADSPWGNKGTGAQFHTVKVLILLASPARSLISHTGSSYVTAQLCEQA